MLPSWRRRERRPIAKPDAHEKIAMVHRCSARLEDLDPRRLTVTLHRTGADTWPSE